MVLWSLTKFVAEGAVWLDLVNFRNLKKLMDVDISKTALNLAITRLKPRHKNVEIVEIEENLYVVPIETDSIDFFHSFGLSHHATNLDLEVSQIFSDLNTLK